MRRGCGVMSWNTKNVKPAQVPQTWAELWDMKRFSGQRGFWKQPYQTMELALMADGVPMDKLYPIDVDRALKSSRSDQVGYLLVEQRRTVGANPDRWRHCGRHGLERPCL